MMLYRVVYLMKLILFNLSITTAFTTSLSGINSLQTPKILCTHKGYRPKALLFEGGGTLGVIYGGVAKRLEESGFTNNVNLYAGTSVGSHAAALLAFGYTGNELIQAIKDMPIRSFLDGRAGFFQRLFRLLRNYGYFRGQTIEIYLDKLFTEKYGIERCSMQKLYELTGNELRVGVCNIITRRYEMIDRHSHPNIPVSVACRASSAIPLLFEPVSWENNMYVDGGLNANLPADAFPKIPALACNLVSIYDENSTDTYRPRNLLQFIRAIINIIFYASQEKHGRIIEGGETDSIDIVYPHNVGPYDFKMSEEQKDILIQVGINAVDKYISTMMDSNSKKSSLELDF